MIVSLLYSVKTLKPASLTKVAFLIFYLFLLSDTGFGQGKVERWKVKFNKEIDWMKLSDAGVLLVGVAGEGVLGLSPQDGSTLWEHKERKKERIPEELVEVIEGSKYIIIHGQKNGKNSGEAYVIDASTGEEKFTAKDKLPAGVSGGIMPLYNTESLLLIDEDHFVNVNPETGEVLWDVEEFVSGGSRKIDGAAVFPLRPDKESAKQMTLKGNQPLLFDSENTFIAHLALQHLAKYNAKTGERVWTFDFKDNKLKQKQETLSAPQYGYATMLIDEDSQLLFFPLNETIIGIHTETGKLVWEADKRLIKGTVTDMTLNKGKLIVLCDVKDKRFIAQIDPATGESTWDKPTKVKEMQQFALLDGDLYALADRSIVRVDQANGDTEKITRNGVKLKYDELPEELMTYNGKLIVTSSHNIMSFNPDGDELFHTALKPIKESGFGIAGKALGATVLNVLSISGVYKRWFLTGRNKKGVIHFPAKRFKNSQDHGWYKYVATKVKDADEGKDFGIARVDIRTGAITNQMAIGERDIVYSIDEIDHLLFAKVDRKRIVCYEF